MMVGQIAEQPSAQRTHQEPRREEQRGIELLHHWVGIREEGAREVEREGRISIKVVPFDQIAD